MIYLDNNATTQPAAEVREAMWPWLGERYGNPSSLHPLGTQAAEAVAAARRAVAKLVGARSPREVLFTSGGTESNYSALRGALAGGQRSGAILCSRVEHSAVLETCARLAKEGWRVEPICVDADGRLDLEHLLARIAEGGVALVSIMAANNETGIVHDIAPIGAACRAARVPFHVDAVQMAGKLPLSVEALQIDLLSLSSHKLHGPKGVGALYVRRGTPFQGPIAGGPQEEERRAGTENVPGIVGLGKAAQLALEWLASDGPTRLAALRDRLEQGLLAAIPDAHAHGATLPRLPNTSSLLLPGVSGEALTVLLGEDGLCVSSGSACASGKHAPSHVLLAMGLDPVRASSSVRFSLSRQTTPEEVERALELTPSAVARLRALAPSSGPAG